MKLRAACIQTNAASDVATNLQRIEPMIWEAHEKGADLITLPENCSCMIKGNARALATAKPETEDQAIAFFARMAQKTGAWILAGSLGVLVDPTHIANRSFLFDPNGNITARYDKIHLFDVTLNEQEFYRESETVRPGDQAVLADTPWGKLGMTVCYDLRFPHLYRALAQAGAALITIPAAFTVTTGKMHWHILNRARAIETGCFILAPAQSGIHDGNRQTFGHSLIVAPNGAILAEAGDQPGVIMAELDMDLVQQARQMIPSLTHDRTFSTRS